MFMAGIGIYITNVGTLKGLKLFLGLRKKVCTPTIKKCILKNKMSQERKSGSIVKLIQ